MGSPFKEHPFFSPSCPYCVQGTFDFLDGVEDEKCENDNLDDDLCILGF